MQAPSTLRHSRTVLEPVCGLRLSFGGSPGGGTWAVSRNWSALGAIVVDEWIEYVPECHFRVFHRSSCIESTSRARESTRTAISLLDHKKNQQHFLKTGKVRGDQSSIFLVEHFRKFRFFHTILNEKIEMLIIFSF